MNSSIEIKWAGQSFVLYADRAAFWVEESALLIADPHFGKTAAFRAAGIPIPTGTTRTNIARLESLLKLTVAKHLIILGDLFHHISGQTPAMLEAISDWRR